MRLPRGMVSRKNIVVDSTLYSRNLREEFYSIAENMKIPVFVVECVCPEDMIRKRIEKRDIDKGASNVNRMEVYDIVKSMYESPATDGKPLIIYDTCKTSISQVNTYINDKNVKRIISSLKGLT